MSNISPEVMKPRRILYVASDEAFFTSHFLHIAQAAQRAGFVTALAARASQPTRAAETMTIYPLAFDRKNRGLRAQLGALPGLFSAVQTFQPDVLHIIGLQAILVFAPLLALFSGVKLVLAPIGLGRFWIEKSATAQLARGTIKFVLFFLRGKNISYVFENPEDASALGFADHNPTVVGGAGIDEKAFAEQSFPAAPPVKAAVVARMLHSKGIVETVDAVRLARSMGADITLDLWGAPDDGNPSSLREDQLNALSHDGIAWRGVTRDVKSVWLAAHVAVLLSAREGLPKTLLEAAACGRPIVTTDVPGCRTLVRDGMEGFVVPFGNTDAAARALLQLAQDEGLRHRMGHAARARIENGFTETQVQDAMLALYKSALKL